MDGIFVSNVTVTLTATDEGVGVQYTTYKLDAAGWMTYDDPFIVADDGNHTIMFYSVDRNGNIEEQHTTIFIIQHHPILSLHIQGGTGVSVVVENIGLTSAIKVPWSINLSGGIILKGVTKEGIIPQLLPGQQKTLFSSVLGFGRTTITAMVDETSMASKAFIFLIFVLGVQ
jgi:hypothetical protein